MTKPATILDMCCGSRMFWFNKQDTRTVFADIRSEEHELCDGRRLVISPDLIADFRSLPFADSTFPVVVFDPPHLERVGQSAWMGKKYGRLNKKHGVLIYEPDSKRLSAYCGHTEFSYSNGTRRRSRLARFWRLQMLNLQLASVLGRTTKPTGSYLRKKLVTIPAISKAPSLIAHTVDYMSWRVCFFPRCQKQSGQLRSR